MSEIVWIINDQVAAHNKIFLRKVQLVLEKVHSYKVGALFIGEKRLVRRELAGNVIHFWWLPEVMTTAVRGAVTVSTPIPLRGYSGRRKWYVADTPTVTLWLRGLGVHPVRIFSIYREVLDPAEFASALLLVYDYLRSLQGVK
jgi:hypothetical protein